MNKSNFCLLATFGLLIVSSDLVLGQKEATKFQPLVKDLYTADPSAHVFNGKIYIYPSHDVEADVPQDDEGGHFQMRDYHVYSMDRIGGKVTDHGVALDVKNVPWAEKQMWAPDAAYKKGTYFLYFPGLKLIFKRVIFSVSFFSKNQTANNDEKAKMPVINIGLTIILKGKSLL